MSGLMLRNKTHTAPSSQTQQITQSERTLLKDANVTFTSREENVPEAQCWVFTICTEKGHLMPGLMLINKSIEMQHFKKRNSLDGKSDFSAKPEKECLLFSPFQSGEGDLSSPCLFYF